jgi:hypothetical protein
MKVRLKPPGRRRPLDAVPLMQELAGNWLVEAKTMSLSKLDHRPIGFLSRRLSRDRALWHFRKGGFLNQGREVFLQRHTAGLRLRHETGLDVRLEVKGNRHGILCFLQFTSGLPSQICLSIRACGHSGISGRAQLAKHNPDPPDPWPRRAERVLRLKTKHREADRLTSAYQDGTSATSQPGYRVERRAMHPALGRPQQGTGSHGVAKPNRSQVRIRAPPSPRNDGRGRSCSGTRPGEAPRSIRARCLDFAEWPPGRSGISSPAEPRRLPVAKDIGGAGEV